MEDKKEIFKKGSKTYYNASRFFPKKVRDEVFTLYAFVRVADDYVDSIPQQKKEFLRLKKETLETIKGKQSTNKLITDFIKLAKRKNFDENEIKAFLKAMEFDLKGKQITSMDKSIEYMYGSAEVIGLFMCKIINLKEELYPYAQLLGRAMQYINFIRDINEDLEINRWYLPIEKEDAIKPNKKWLQNNTEEFNEYIQKQLAQYFIWQQQAEYAFKYIPRVYRIPIKVASQMYKWTAKQIAKNPQIVFKKQVKPSKARIIATYFKEVFS